MRAMGGRSRRLSGLLDTIASSSAVSVVVISATTSSGRPLVEDVAMLAEHQSCIMHAHHLAMHAGLGMHDLYNS